MGNFDDSDKEYDLSHELPEPALPINKIRTLGPHFRIQPKISHHDKQQHRYYVDETQQHFHELTIAVAQLHEKLIKCRSPYRFCVYKEHGEVMIDMVKLDEYGQLGPVEQHDITHEEFLKWVHEFEDGEGLLFDRTA